MNLGVCAWGVKEIFLAKSETFICDLTAGPRESKFSVQFHHGGYFFGEGINRSYVDGRVVWYDQIDKLTWSPIMIEHLVDQMVNQIILLLHSRFCNYASILLLY